MKKFAAAAVLIIFIFAIQVTYINYRLEQKLNTIEQAQQNILTKVWSLERRSEQVRQILQEEPINPTDKHNLLLTSDDPSKQKYDQQKMEGIN